MADQAAATPSGAEAHDGPAQRRLTFDRAARLLRDETARVRLALGFVALHIADDNYLQPEPGTSAGDHLASGLVPIAVLALVAYLYPRARAGARAAIAMTFGVLGITIGVPGAYYVLDGTASGDHWTGLLSILAGVVLLLGGPVTLWKARRRGGTRRERYLRRSLTVVAGVALGFVLIWLVVFPVSLAYIYTHTGRTASQPAPGAPFEPVTVTTSDSLELAAWYAPSVNGAAVVVFPGATRAKEAGMIARNGYGVLLLESRGQGGSEGDIVRWAGDRDLLAGAAFLAAQPEVDPERIGAIGYSIGGEILLETAAKSDAFAAVVSDGAGERVGEQDASGAEKILVVPLQTVLTAAVTVFSNHGPPPPIVERIGLIAPRPIFLISAEHGIGNENGRQPRYFAAAGEPKAIWEVPGAKHTGGIDAAPEEYERRVVGFFDRALPEGS